MTPASIAAYTLGFTLAIVAAGTVSADDDGELAALCDSCHGPAGVSVHDDVPTIAGQSAEFLMKTLRGFQRWDRPCIKTAYRHGDTSRPRTDMCRIAEGLSDGQIQAASAHYAALEFKPAAQSFDPALAAEGEALHQENCEKCHQQGGAQAAVGPRLAGQWTPYLRISLKFVPTGEHMVPGRMEHEIAALAPQELDKLLHFYASQQD